MSFGIGSDVDDVLTVVVVEQLRDGDDHIFAPSFACWRVTSETAQIFFKPRILLAAPLSHGADEELQIFDCSDEGALQLRLPRDRALHDSSGDPLYARRQCGDAACLCHRRTTTESARRGGELGGIGRLQALPSSERLKAGEILTGLEGEEIQ